MKRGMAINIIVIAVIAILVLIVLAMIFSERTGRFSKTISNCNVLGGKCVSHCKGTEIPADCKGIKEKNLNGVKWTIIGEKMVCCVEK